MPNPHVVSAEATAPASTRRRSQGIALAVIAATQLMVSLDDTIVNIALPSIQTALDISAANLTWVFTAYALTFGGLLLLGGRAGDLFGRVRMFRLGIGLFILASLIGGLAQNEALLIGARAAQGIGAAIAAPTALALIATTFTDPESRNKAMGLYGGMGGLGSTVGLLLGGVLTEYLDWRWVMFVNVPIGLLVLAGTRHLVEGGRTRGRLDLPGAVVGTAGAIALVFGLNRGGVDGFSDGRIVAVLVAGVLLIALFLLLQARGTDPVLPLRLLRDSSRSGSMVTMLLVFGGMFATYYFLTLYMQQVLEYSAVRTGLAYLPFSVGMAVAAGGLAPKLLQTVAPRVIIAAGLVTAAVGLFWFSTLSPDSSFVALLLPGMIVTSLGLGLTFVPLTVGGVGSAPMEDLGAASGLLNTSQQLGAAIGVAVLPALALAVANDQLPNAGGELLRAAAQRDDELFGRAAEALTQGYQQGFLAGAAFLVVGIVVALITIKTPAPPQPEPAQA